MTPHDPFGPFQPGAGGMPPHLAGREPEQTLLGALLRRMRERAAFPGQVILLGPRGNGKTVLLRWLKNEAAAAGVEVAAPLPSEVRNAEQFVERLRPRRRWWWRSVPAEPVSAILAARAAKAPFLLIVDEAHTLTPKVGQALLQASQQARESGPFLMVLAGTPDIEERLSRMHASFWSRAHQLRIGRISEDATGEAFRRPFEAEGIQVDRSVLPDVFRRSHGYPYFIQLLGAAVWGVACAPDGPRRVTSAALEAALPRFTETRNFYYRQRYDELRKEGLLPAGRSVALAFAGSDSLSDGKVEQAIREGLGDSSATTQAEGTLADLGFIWRPRSEPGWEPGIPSLMDYVAEHAPAQ